jgi:hypothetical protein
MINGLYACISATTLPLVPYYRMNAPEVSFGKQQMRYEAM